MTQCEPMILFLFALSLGHAKYRAYTTHLCQFFFALFLSLLASWCLWLDLVTVNHLHSTQPYAMSISVFFVCCRMMQQMTKFEQKVNLFVITFVWRGFLRACYSYFTIWFIANDVVIQWYRNCLFMWWELEGVNFWLFPILSEWTELAIILIHGRQRNQRTI